MAWGSLGFSEHGRAVASRPGALGVWLPGLALVCATSALADTAAGAPRIRFSSPDGSAVLHAGETVQVSWDRLGDSVEEAELLLVLDEGTGFRVRLTSDFEPARESSTWVVPNLPALSARIRLRVGIDGREVETEPSEPFRIEGTAEKTPAALRFSSGEWWLGTGSFTPHPQPRRHPWAALARDDGRQPDAVLGDCPPAAATAVAASLRSPGAIEDDLRRRASAPLLPRTPRFVPQRD